MSCMAWVRPNNSFKPTPCRGVSRVLCATLARVRRPATGRLNSGVRPHRLVMQHFEIWHPIASYPAAIVSAWAVQLGPNELLVICDGPFDNSKCLVLAFGPIEELRVADDYVQRWEPELQHSQPPGQPLLQVADSQWAASSFLTNALEQPLQHFCVLAGDFSVEVLASSEPTVRWASSDAVDTFFNQGLALGGA
jgi:hypothetical protein